MDFKWSYKKTIVKCKKENKRDVVFQDVGREQGDQNYANAT